jgi:hypothetical protein
LFNLQQWIHNLDGENPHWDVRFCSSGQGILHIFYNSQTCYSVQKSTPLYPVLSKMNLVYILPFSSFKIHIISFIPCMCWSYKIRVPSPFRFSEQLYIFMSFLMHACYVSCPTHISWCNDHNNVCWRIWIMDPLMQLFSMILLLPLSYVQQLL